MTAKGSPVERLLDLLERTGEASTAVEVAEMLWIAARLPARRSGRRVVAPVPLPAVPPPLPSPPVRESLPPSRGESFGSGVTATSTTASGPSSADLYPAQAGVSAGGIGAQTIRSPGALALPGSLELGRSLRPLKRRVPSRAHYVLDEVATAHRIADTGEWIPVLSPAPERWLDIVLVVDESSSMIIWERTVAEIQRLLERQGAFRSIDVLGFRAGPDSRSVEIYPGIGPRAERARRHRPAELIDPMGRRLIAVVSDCVSPVWHNGAMATLLCSWGLVGQAAVVQVLPDRLWVRTGLRTYPAVYLRSPAPGAPNGAFEIEWTNYRPKPGGPRGTAVPVVSLEAQSLDHWARAIAGHTKLWIPGVFAIPAVGAPDKSRVTPETITRPATKMPPEQLVRQFYGTASPTARRLASIFAAAPLTLPVMRLLQRALLPESRQVHLAEVWLSGLIDRPAEVDHVTPADHVEYFFVNGVRDLLLNNLRLGEVEEVLTAVSGYVGERLGQPLDFAALIADPRVSGDVQIAQGYQSFARVAASALRRFGGQYADLARRLETSVHGKTVRAEVPTSEVRVESEAMPSAPDARPGTGHVRALLVAANRHATNQFQPLQGPGNDIELTRQWLQERFRVSAADIVVLEGERATKQAILDALRQCASDVAEGDQLFFQFSGHDHAIATNDPLEADGLEETLFVYDSISDDRATLLTHEELAGLVAEVAQRGGRTTLLLDSGRTASGLLARRALTNTLVFAAAAEVEEAYETSIDGKAFGAVSYFLAKAMQASRPGMTWLDVHDQVLAQILVQEFKQTPQLIGPGDLTVFGAERRPVPPYLVVTKADERGIEVHASPALSLGSDEPGARLAIYPPGSTMDGPPIGFARVTRQTEGVVAASFESPVTVPVASRVRVLEPGGRGSVIRVGLDSGLLEQIGAAPLVAFLRDDADHLDFTLALAEDEHLLLDREGHQVWRELAASGASPEDRSARLRTVTQHLAAYLRTSTLQNPDLKSDLAGKVDLELVSPAQDDVVTLNGTEPLTLKLRNRAAVSLFVSVWMLDEFLGIEKIFPPTTSCVLLGKGRDITLAVALRPHGDGERPMQISFKVFATSQPADLGLLSLPRLERPFDLALMDRTLRRGAPSESLPAPRRTKPARAPSAGKKSKGAAWAPGGPVAKTSALWKTGMTLRVKFLSGHPALQKRVMEAAVEWTRYANLRFEVVRKGDAELRVGFKDEGYWSYVGTEALLVPADQPTINLGGLTSRSWRHEVRATVLHYFGHALGMLRAYQSPVAEIPWNKKAVYEYFGKLQWDRAAVDSQVFAKFDRTSATYGPPDPHSIMYHNFAKELTDGKTAIVPGTELSDGDKQLIAQLYPGRAQASRTDDSAIRAATQTRKQAGRKQATRRQAKKR